ncbi:MAG: hypothetical protein ABI158_06935, partial [Edaphobacter sp.]
MAKLFEGRDDALGYLFHGSLTIHFAETVAGPVVLNDWRGERFVGFHPLGKGGFSVVAPMLKRASINIANTRRDWQMGIDIVDVFANRA